jgi:hypothetical protein
VEVFLHCHGVTSAQGIAMVSLVTRENTRRVFVLGVAGLLPAALVTLLFLQQPAIGHRRLYPLLRVPLAAIALTLALATVIAWARSSKRSSRQALSGLAWAAVAVLLCIGPFVESDPRDRLFALTLDGGDVAWATSRAAANPRLIDDVLVVDEEDVGARVCLEPADGTELGRVERDADPQLADVQPECREALAEDRPADDDHLLDVVDGRLEAAGTDPWTLEFPGERVLAVVETDDGAYAYVATPAPVGSDDPVDAVDAGAGAGAVVRIGGDGNVVWRSPLDEDLIAVTNQPALAATDSTAIVAGGESIGALDAASGKEDWSESVVALGKSRGYALPEALHEIVVYDVGGSDDDLVFLSVTPEA